MYKKSSAIIIVIFLLTWGAYSPAYGFDDNQKSDLVTLSKEILLRAAEIGMEEVGFRFFGPNLWRVFKAGAAPLFNRLKEKYPAIFSARAVGSKEAKNQAMAATRELESSKQMQELLINGFSSLERGQEKILDEISRINFMLIRVDSSLRHMDIQHSAALDKILDELRAMRERRESYRPKQAAIARTTLFEDNFETEHNWLVQPDSRILRSTYAYGGLLLENLTEHEAALFDFAKLGIIEAPVKIDISFTLLNSDVDKMFGLMFAGKSRLFRDSYTFSITGKGRFIIDYYRNNMQEKFIDYGTDSAIKTGKNSMNKLSIEIEGSEIRYFINGKHLGTYNSQEGFNGYVGVYLNLPGLMVLVDNLKISRL